MAFVSILCRLEHIDFLRGTALHDASEHRLAILKYCRVLYLLVAGNNYQFNKAAFTLGNPMNTVSTSSIAGRK